MILIGGNNIPPDFSIINIALKRILESRPFLFFLFLSIFYVWRTSNDWKYKVENLKAWNGGMSIYLIRISFTTQKKIWKKENKETNKNYQLRMRHDCGGGRAELAVTQWWDRQQLFMEVIIPRCMTHEWIHLKWSTFILAFIGLQPVRWWTPVCEGSDGEEKYQQYGPHRFLDFSGTINHKYWLFYFFIYLLIMLDT